MLTGISAIVEQPTSSAGEQTSNNSPSTIVQIVRDDEPSTSTAITHQPTGDKFREGCLKDACFEGRLEPGDIKLSSAMAMSAAAVSPYLGKYEDEERQATHILTVLGMNMAANTVYNLKGERDEHRCSKVK